MSTIVIIAEKPSVGREIAKALLEKKSAKNGYIEGLMGSQSIISSWVHGHLVELVYPDAYNPEWKRWDISTLPLCPLNWEFKDKVKPSAKTQYKVLSDILKTLPKGAEVVNACDAGREGELIFYKLIRKMNLHNQLKLTRMWYQSTTAEDFRDSFKNRQDYITGRSGPVIYSGLRESSIVRDESDWFLGINGTRLLTKSTPPGSFYTPAKGNKKATLIPKHVGRVKTPTMSMIVDRDNLIDNFIPEDFFEVEGHFNSGIGKADLTPYVKYRLSLLGVYPQDKMDERKVFWEKIKAEAFSNASKGRYSVKDSGSTVKSRPPMAFSLTTAQREGNKRFGWSAAYTLEILQSLYEKGLMSYPRTEYSAIPTNLKNQVVGMLSKVHSKIGELNGGVRFSKELLPEESLIRAAKVFDDSKIGDHYALMPTGDLSQLSSIDQSQTQAFLMIYESILCSVDASAEYKEALRVWTKQNNSGDYNPIKFTEKSKILTFPGWTRWQDKKVSNSMLSTLNVSEEELNKSVILSKKTSAPKPYNEATLLRAMETAGSSGYEDEEDISKEENLISLMKGKGLGTPATRAEIIEGLKKSGYIKLQKKNIISTSRAKELISLVRERSPRLASPRETAEWEFELHKMEINAPDALSRLEFLNRLKSEFLTYKQTCIKLGIPANVGGTKSLDLMCPKSGSPIQEGEKYYRFPGYPKLACWKNLWGRDFKIEEWIQIIKAYMNSEEIEFTGFKSKDGTKTYNGKVYLSGDKWSVESASSGGRPKEISVLCPKSKKPFVEYPKFFKAPGYPDRMLWKSSFGRDMPPEIWVEILKSSKKSPYRLQDCISKAGNRYEPDVYFSGKNIKMEFPK